MRTGFCFAPLIALLFLCTPGHAHQGTIEIKLLGINDFHGQITTGRLYENEPAGGAAILAAYLKQAQKGMEDRTVITIMGDLIGASTPASALLHDEPTMLIFNNLGNEHCSPEIRDNPLCNIVATVGNHEFDRGKKALFDLIYGTNTPPTEHWYPATYYPGTAFPYISANIIDAQTKKLLFPPYTMKQVDGVRIAFIGAILKNAAATMMPANAEGMEFLDEAEAINHYIPEVKSKGAELIVVLIHEGGKQTPYDGSTQEDTQVTGRIKDIVLQLENYIDVVMAGHTHAFLNAYLPNQQGHSILVTEAQSYSTAFAEVTLTLDAHTHQLIQKTARIIPTYANFGTGAIPDHATSALVQLAEDKVAPIIYSPIGTASESLLRVQNEAGESSLGNLVADAFKNSMNAEIGLTNIHGLRDDINLGSVNQGTIYSVLPFHNYMVLVTLTGEELYQLLEQQWMSDHENILQISGISYTYDAQKPVGHKITTICHQRQPILRDKTYTIATSDFLASGGNHFSIMKKCKRIKIGVYDFQALINWIQSLPQPFTASIEGRIQIASTQTKP